MNLPTPNSVIDTIKYAYICVIAALGCITLSLLLLAPILIENPGYFIYSYFLTVFLAIVFVLCLSYRGDKK